MSQDTKAMLSFILGNQIAKMANETQLSQKVNRKLVMSSAMFWDSKKRIEKIKTLFLNSVGLKQFDDTSDFKVCELESIELLSLSKNQIVHLHPLSQLTSLVSLNVSFNKVYDLNPLCTLQRLEELYASNNQIKSVQPLKQLNKLKNLQLYKNKIHNFKETFETVASLAQLIQLDIEENLIAEDRQFLELLSGSFPGLKKLNGQLNKSTQKIKEMSSSKGFMNSSMRGFGTTPMFGTASMFFNGNSSTVNTNPQRTLYDFCRKKSSNSQVWERRKQKENMLNKLQDLYKQLDEDFEKQIVKNVRLKSRLYKMVDSKRVAQDQREQLLSKGQQTKQLKRKIKALKEQLFTKDRKGELLRRLFEAEMTPPSKHPHTKSQLHGSSQDIQQTPSDLQKLKGAINQIKWIRKFQADQLIVIQTNDRYLEGDQDDIGLLLGSIDDSIRDLKCDMDYLS